MVKDPKKLIGSKIPKLKKYKDCPEDYFHRLKVIAFFHKKEDEAMYPYEPAVLPKYVKPVKVKRSAGLFNFMRVFLP